MELSNLTANLAGKIRRETLNGESYIVAPLTMIVEGVLNGSQGPLLYPQDEITKNVDAWNGMPIVVTHPTVNGIPVSARSPDILETFGIGYVFNATIKGKLVAEGWFNVEKTRKVDERVLNSLEAGTPIELSTGLFTTNEPAEEGAVFNGKEYSFVARNYRPDHLAVLPDEVGACSLKDGCGVLVNKDNKATLLSKIMGAVGSVLSPTGNKLSYNDIHNQLVKQLGIDVKEDFWIEDVYKTSVVYHRNGKTYQQGYTVGTNDVVTLKDELPVEVVKKTNYTKVENASDVASDKAPEVGSKDQERIPTGNNKEPEVNEDQKRELIDDLVANCSCWTDEDREVLNKFSDEKLTKLSDHSKKVRKANEKPSQPVANSQPTEEPAKTLTEEEWLANAPAGIRSAVANAQKIEKREREELIGKLTANVSNDKKEAVKATLNNKSLEDLELMVSLIPATPSPQEPNRRANFFGAAVPSEGPTANKDSEDFDENDTLIPPTINFAEAV